MTGGALVVGQSGGPTAVINSTLAGVLAEARQHAAIRTVYGLRHGVEGLLARNWVELPSGNPALTNGLRRTPAAALGSTRHRLTDDAVDTALDILQREEVRYFVLIGGNDSADSTDRLQHAAARRGLALQAVGAPKTIDNDLPVTDHCLGYGSIARYLAVSVQETALDTHAMRRSDPIRIVEVMGRDAGWVAAAAALGRERPDLPPHLLYLPERPTSAAQILREIEDAYRTHGFAVIVLCENQTEPTAAGPRVLGASGEPEWVDAFGHAYFPSPAAYLCRRIRDELGLRARFEKPGNFQRTSRALVSPVDEREAFSVGRAAVRAAVAGHGGQMVTLIRRSDDPYRCTLGLAPLAAIANQTRPLPPEYLGPCAAEPTTAAFAAYARPLLGGPLPSYVRI